MEGEKKERPPLPYLESLRERRGLMRMEAIKQSEEADEEKVPPQASVESDILLHKIANMQSQTAQTMAWMAQKMRDSRTSVPAAVWCGDAAEHHCTAADCHHQRAECVLAVFSSTAPCRRRRPHDV